MQGTCYVCPECNKRTYVHPRKPGRKPRSEVKCCHCHCWYDIAAASTAPVGKKGKGKGKAVPPPPPQHKQLKMATGIKWDQRPYKEGLKLGTVKRATPQEAQQMRQREIELAQQVQRAHTAQM